MNIHNGISRDTSRAEPLRWPELPELSSEVADAERRIFQRSGNYSCNIAGQNVVIAGPFRLDERPPLIVDLRFGENVVRAFLPDDVPGMFMKLHGIEDEWQGYDRTTVAMVLEHLLAPSFASVDVEFESLLRIETVDPSEDLATDPDLCLSVTFGVEETRIIGLSSEPHLLTQLVDKLVEGQAPVKPPDLRDIPFTAQLLGPAFSSTQEDLNNVQIGGGFLLERDWVALRWAELLVADNLIANARHNMRGFRLTRNFSSFNSTDRPQEALMPTMSQTDQQGTAALPVTVRIELAATTLTLAELRKMEAGSILPFAEELPNSVGLLANGKPFGRGDLVRIDGKIAVRLTEIG
ncbi:FliM/FliN family flagellar motor switch protein [uncultured Tateyamaria sp.]|uniref:FliM/FliN family flagellar motor switch protein n=1 Tax=uncultured Tateyamaria sp. TaxID=455651 RepID=UPI002639A646|nr:FliM/FliN family flagellar motor switch protein [uncultured Tateyamaria sp.]